MCTTYLAQKAFSVRSHSVYETFFSHSWDSLFVRWSRQKALKIKFISNISPCIFMAVVEKSYTMQSPYLKHPQSACVWVSKPSKIHRSISRSKQIHYFLLKRESSVWSLRDIRQNSHFVTYLESFNQSIKQLFLFFSFRNFSTKIQKGIKFKFQISIIVLSFSFGFFSSFSRAGQNFYRTANKNS